MFEFSSFPRAAVQPLISITVKTPARVAALGALALGMLCLPESLMAQAPTPVPVLTWRYDLTHAGQNTSETALKPSNVNVSSFGKLFSLAVDSTVYAQPLYVPGLKMSDGKVHNVLFVATENDSIYAFDADSNGGSNSAPIWQISLLTKAHGAGSGATPQQPADTGEGDIGPTIGITGTPTINTATNTMYVIGATKESGVNYSRLHAINILTGAERTGSPVEVTASAAGNGDGSSGGKVPFSALYDNQRSALDYYNGYVYFGYAAHGDIGPWHGWLFAYNATTLKQSAAICLSPNDHGAGIWESGAGMPIDDDAPGGRMFLATGNGAVSTYPPFAEGSDLSMSVLDFSLADGGIKLTDGFTSYNYETINAGDLDQGSGGVLMVPDQQGSHPHVLVQAGKEGRILVLNRDDLGGDNVGGSSNPKALQDITGALTYTHGLWSTPAYWNGNVYMWAEKDTPMLFKLNSGVMDTAPNSKSSIYSDFPGASFSISSDGVEDGIAWAVRTDQFATFGPEVLYAWDATDLAKTIYESDTDSARDAAGTANKFSIPLVTNGKVYVAADGEVDVYGLFNGEPTAVAPKISPDGGTFAATQKVALSSATSSAEIFYTLDGTVPTPASTLYTDPITISMDATVRAMASAPGYIQSAVSTATFTFSDQTPLLKFSPAGGTYLAAQHVTITDSDANAKIYYTTNGSTPSASSKLYKGPIAVLVSETIKAVAIDPKLKNSDIGTSVYVIQEGGSSINFGSGFATTTGLTLNGSTLASNDTRLQLTNGQLWEHGSVFWNAPINVQAFTTDFEFQLSNAQGNGFTFTIQNVGPKALGGDSAGLGYQNILKSVAVKFNFYNYENEGDDSTGVYTDGEPPVLPTVDVSPSGIELGGGDAIEAQITYNGKTLTLHLHDPVTNDNFTMSKVINIPQIVGGNTAYVGFTGGTGGLSASQKLLSWTYATNSVPPAFAPAAGTYRSAQKVALSSASAGAAIYYTTNGTAPTAASTHYTGPIAVDKSETIKAIAISPTTGSSSVVSAAYVIQESASGAAFSLSAAPAAAITQGSSTTSTITITPSGGFTGSVALACVITAVSSGASVAPTCSASEPPEIANASPVTSTLRIDTQATTSPGTFMATVTGSSGSVTDSASVQIKITQAATPTFALSGGSINIDSPGESATSTLTITPRAGFTGNVAVACSVSGPSGTKDAPTCTASQPTAIAGTQPVTSTITVKTQSGTTPGTYTATVTGSSGSVDETLSVAITVIPAGTATFTLSGAPVSIVAPGASGSSTVTITPKGGFTGSVSVACAVTAGPSGAVNAPACSASQPEAISGTGSVTSTLSITTTPAAEAALHKPMRPGTALGGGTLAALLFFCVPFRRRKWQSLSGLLMFLAVGLSAIGCGSYSVATGAAGAGTTAGNYTFTVTGTSGSVKVMTTVAVTVE
jgi:hypothetical protein